MSRGKGTLVAEFGDYRLVSYGKWSQGYEDGYVLEKKSEDALGETRWIDTGRDFGESKAMHDANPLIQAVKALKLERANHANTRRRLDESTLAYKLVERGDTV